MPQGWEAIAARLEALAQTEDEAFRRDAARLQLAVRAQTKPYTLDTATVILAQLEQRLPADVATSQAGSPTFEYQQFSTQEQINIGTAFFNSGGAPSSEEPQPVVASVVVVAMNRDEAESLITGDAFESLPSQLREHFDQLHTL